MRVASQEVTQLSRGIHVEELTVGFGRTTAVRGVTLAVSAGEVLGLVGETGSGKSTLCKAIAGILPPQATVSGSVHLNGRPGQLVRKRAVGGGDTRIGFVFQSPDAALNPCIRVGTQLTEQLVNQGQSGTVAQERAGEMLKRMGISDVKRVMLRYPHELSGGQQQRVCIASTLLTGPEVLLLDEPTTALDVTTQASILQLIQELLAKTSIPAVYVTHDLRLITNIASRIAVMTEGEVVELGTADEVLRNPSHPYTRSLIASQPEFGLGVVLRQPRDRTTSARESSTGCGYAWRCPIVEPQCVESAVPLRNVAVEHSVRCLFPETAVEVRIERRPSALLSEKANHRGVEVGDAEILVGVSHVSVDLGKARQRHTILNDVTFSVRRRRTVAVVGETGAGKSTLARTILGLLRPAAGEIRMGTDKLPPLGKRSRDECARIQMVFQSSAASLNPRRTIRSILSRQLRRLGEVPRSEVDERLLRLLEEVQLSPKLLPRRTADLSGGEKQRVAIARALAARAELVILDEAVSSLDVSTQAAILSLLNQVQAALGVAYLFISHDLAVVGAMADEILVLYGGRIVEAGPKASVLEIAHHPYTEVLLRSVPGGLPLSTTSLKSLDGGLNRATRGCVFAERCPWRLGDLCTETPPPARRVGAGHEVRCHYEIPDLVRLFEEDRKQSSTNPPGQVSVPLAATVGASEEMGGSGRVPEDRNRVSTRRRRNDKWEVS